MKFFEIVIQVCSGVQIAKTLESLNLAFDLDRGGVGTDAELIRYLPLDWRCFSLSGA